MPARISGDELVVGVQLLGCVHHQGKRLTIVQLDFSAIMIEYELRVDQIAMVLQQPVHSIRLAAFLISSQGQNDVAIRNEALLFHANQRRDHDGVATFHVLGAAAIKVAVLLDKLEWVRSPVLAPGFDHVEMSNQQHRLVLARTVQARNYVFLAIIRAKNMDIAVGKSRISEPLRHGLPPRPDQTSQPYRPCPPICHGRETIGRLLKLRSGANVPLVPRPHPASGLL